MIELLPKSLAKKRLVSVQMAFTLPMFECCSSLDCISPQLDIRGRAPLRTTAGNHLVIRIIHGSISSIASVIQTRGTQLMHPHTQAVPFEPTGRSKREKKQKQMHRKFAPRCSRRFALVASPFPQLYISGVQPTAREARSKNWSNGHKKRANMDHFARSAQISSPQSGQNGRHVKNHGAKYRQQSHRSSCGWKSGPLQRTHSPLFRHRTVWKDVQIRENKART